MSKDERTGELRTQARRRFLHRVTLLAGGFAFAPLFARTIAATTDRIPSESKSGHVVVFPGSDANALDSRVTALGYGWTPVADEAAARASVAGRGNVAVIGIGVGVVAALRFARSHADVKAVLVMGAEHGEALEEFRALLTPRAYAVQVLGATDAVNWHDAGRWLDQHMA